MKGSKKIYQANGLTKQAEVAILISDKVDFKPKLVKREKEGQGTIHQKEITIVNLYEPNVRTSNFIKHTLLDLKTQIVPSTVMVGEFNIPLSPVYQSSRQKNRKRNSRVE
jgi:hypothetical protein